MFEGEESYGKKTRESCRSWKGVCRIMILFVYGIGFSGDWVPVSLVGGPWREKRSEMEMEMEMKMKEEEEKMKRKFGELEDKRRRRR